jgi:hypothetical protein
MVLSLFPPATARAHEEHHGNINDRRLGDKRFAIWRSGFFVAEILEFMRLGGVDKFEPISGSGGIVAALSVG